MLSLQPSPVVRFRGVDKIEHISVYHNPKNAETHAIPAEALETIVDAVHQKGNGRIFINYESQLAQTSYEGTNPFWVKDNYVSKETYTHPSEYAIISIQDRHDGFSAKKMKKMIEEGIKSYFERRFQMIPKDLRDKPGQLREFLTKLVVPAVIEPNFKPREIEQKSRRNSSISIAEITESYLESHGLIPPKD